MLFPAAAVPPLTHPPLAASQPSESAPWKMAGFSGMLICSGPDRPEFKSGFATFQLCDLGQVLNLSEPQFPHL